MSKVSGQGVILWSGATLIAAAAACITSLAIRVGDPAYRRAYPSRELCSVVKAGDSVTDVQRRILALGRPESIDYSKLQLSVGDTQSACILTLDPSNSKITKTTLSGPMITF